MSTGSTSADVMTAPVLAELRRRGRLRSAVGIGGAPLAEQGVERMFDTTPLSAIGIAGSLAVIARNAWEVLGAVRRAEAHFRRRRPDLVMAVDNPAHNIRLLRMARRHRLRTLYYIPPELWSIFKPQVWNIVRSADAIAPVFRVDAEGYRRWGGSVRFVGHPAPDLLAGTARPPDRPAGAPVIALFPGSRSAEVRALLPVLAGAAEIIAGRHPGARFVMCSANETCDARIDAARPGWTVPVEVVRRRSREVLAGCDLLLTCSGTATLEAAVLGVPMVVLYRLSNRIDRILAALLLGDYPYLALPNYLMRRQVVPELREGAVSARRAADEALAVLEDPAGRKRMLAGLAEVREFLGGPGAIRRTADLIEEMLDRPPGPVEGMRNADG